METIQKARDRIASFDVQLTSVVLTSDVLRRDSWGRPRVVENWSPCPSVDRGWAPSGSRPMSSGRRRITMIMGMTSRRLKIPNKRKAVRQSASSVIAENAGMIAAALMGRYIPVQARAMFRRRLKKFTAIVRGTTPIRNGWLTARAITAAMKNCHAICTQPKASIDSPRAIRPTGISQRGPYRSASRPANGAKTPDIRTPQLAEYPIQLRGQPVSSATKIWIPPSTTPATTVAANAPAPESPSTSQP